MAQTAYMWFLYSIHLYVCYTSRSTTVSIPNGRFLTIPPHHGHSCLRLCKITDLLIFISLNSISFLKYSPDLKWPEYFHLDPSLTFLLL